jgi:AcrR family transcriptional regulator
MLDAMRSATTSRAAILAAARHRFGAEGYERTTIRAVAADVGIDPAMVMRYFGNKEGLFAAAAEFELHLPDLTGVAPHRLAEVLLPSFFAVWEREGTFLALLRATVTSETAAAKMREVFARQVSPTLATAAIDHPAERAALVGATVLGLAFSRYVVKTPPLATMPPAELLTWVGPVIQHYLTSPLPAQ